MKSRSYSRKGRRYGNAEKVAQMLEIKRGTWQYYVNNRKPLSNPPPAVAFLDPDTRHQMWDLAAVQEWDETRIGQGHSGAARLATCRYCKRAEVPVSWKDQLYPHRTASSEEAPWCLEGSPPGLRVMPCPDCGQEVALTQKGRIYKHRAGEPRRTCTASGEEPAPADVAAAPA
jgi:hypothetical protein